MASAPELEKRLLRPEVQQPAPAAPGSEVLVSREETPSVSNGVSQVVQPVVQAQPQAVVDEDGTELLTPADSIQVEVHIPYTPERLREMKKEPVEKSGPWLATLWKRIWDHALAFGRRVVFKG